MSGDGKDLHHTHLMASDVDATIRFWVDCFDADVVADTGLAGARNVLLAVGDGRLNLYDQPPNHRGVVNHLGVQVGDLDAALATLISAGWQPREPKRDGSLRYAMVEGPDQLLIEVFHIDPAATAPELLRFFHSYGSPTAVRAEHSGPTAVFGGQPLGDDTDEYIGAGILSAQARAFHDRPGAEPTGPVRHREATVGGIRCLQAGAVNAPTCVLYIHGGQVATGDPGVVPPMPTRLVTPVSNQAETQPRELLSIDYRPAPERRSPAGVDDVVAVVKAVRQRGPERAVVLVGDAAGATIALLTALRLGRSEGPDGLVLFSPQLDLGPGRPPRPADLRTLPPTLVQAGTGDTSLSTAIRFNRMARASGVDATLDIWDGLWPGWHHHRDLPEADRALAEIGCFIDRCVRREQEPS